VEAVVSRRFQSPVIPARHSPVVESQNYLTTGDR
jgi:hypothetical protein